MLRVSWCIQKGVNIVSDGWSDSEKRPLINFIAICENGPMFIKVVNCSEEIKDKYFIANLLKEVIDEVGHEKVGQVITDNAKNCNGVGEIFEGVFPHFHWTPVTMCSAYTISDIGKRLCGKKY